MTVRRIDGHPARQEECLHVQVPAIPQPALQSMRQKQVLPAVVLLPAGKVAVGKVAQALMHGAKVNLDPR